MKPLDTDVLNRIAGSTRGIITVEDHQIKNGLGSAVTDFICDKHPMFVKRIGLQNTFGESGDYRLLLKKYKMDIDHIVFIAKKLMKSIWPGQMINNYYFIYLLAGKGDYAYYSRVDKTILRVHQIDIETGHLELNVVSVGDLPPQQEIEKTFRSLMGHLEIQETQRR